MRRLVLYFLALGLPTAFAQMPSPAAPPAASPQKYTLKATPKTVAWGYYDASAAPVLRIHSGDSVEFETLLTNSPTGLEQAGLPPEQVQQNLRDIYEVTDKGPGGHILNGPVYIEEAEPGDTLEVRIQKIDLAIPYAYNAFGINRGFLPRISLIQNEDHSTGPGSDDGEVHSRNRDSTASVFRKYGSSASRRHTAALTAPPPGIHAGNMDNKELVAGTTLYLPVHARGALFEIGDGHAGQGNGEVDITALETSLTGTVQFLVHKGTQQKYPRAETPTHYISMGFHQELYERTRTRVGR